MQANPDDYQSLEILKEAYFKIGRHADGVHASRTLASMYLQQGQYSSAMLEYEGLLQQDPNAQDIRVLVAELELKLNRRKAPAPQPASIAMDFGIDAGQLAELEVGRAHSDGARQTSESSLISLNGRGGRGRAGAARREAVFVSLDSDGNEPLARFLLQHRLASHEVVNTALERVTEYNLGLAEGKLAASLLDEIAKVGVDMDILLSSILDRTKAAYIPLSIYDVDRQIVKMLPEKLTLGRLLAPFDIVSRTMMVATDNPFDSAARAAAEQMVDYHVQWHLAHPSAIRKVLRDVYRLGN